MISSKPDVFSFAYKIDKIKIQDNILNVITKDFIILKFQLQIFKILTTDLLF
jgi:hypothetical protein